MNLGDLAFRLIIILFPGIISTLIYKKLVIKKRWESIDYSLNTLLYGILSYLFLQSFFYCLKKGNLIIWQRLQDEQAVPNEEVLWASLISIIIGFISSYIENNQCINKIGTYIGFTSKYGENNLFYTFLSNKEISEIHVKDSQNDLTYTGYLKYYSEDDIVRELVLEDVDKFELESSKHIGKLKSIFISKAKGDNLIIEVPYLITDKTIENG